MTTSQNRQDLLTRLTDGIAGLTSSEQWRRYLDFQCRFHQYSFGNVLLIANQYQGATRVAGFNAWRRLNRFVRKGEKAIWIIAPMVYKDASEDAVAGDRLIRGFKFVPVFDVTQTDGEELPSVCVRLDGHDPAGCYASLLKSRGRLVSMSRITASPATRTVIAATPITAYVSRRRTHLHSG